MDYNPNWNRGDIAQIPANLESRRGEREIVVQDHDKETGMLRQEGVLSETEG